MYLPVPQGLVCAKDKEALPLYDASGSLFGWLVGWLFKDKIKLTFYDELDLISNLIENFLSV